MRLVSDILKLMKVYKCFNSKGRSLTLIKTYPFLYKQTNVQTKLICLNIVYIHTVRCAIGSHSQFIENVVSSQCMKFASVLDLLTNVHLHLVGNMFHYSFLFLSLSVIFPLLPSPYSFPIIPTSSLIGCQGHVCGSVGSSHVNRHVLPPAYCQTLSICHFPKSVCVLWLARC